MEKINGISLHQYCRKILVNSFNSFLDDFFPENEGFFLLKKINLMLMFFFFFPEKCRVFLIKKINLMFMIFFFLIKFFYFIFLILLLSKLLVKFIKF